MDSGRWSRAGVKQVHGLLARCTSSARARERIHTLCMKSCACVVRQNPHLEPLKKGWWRAVVDLPDMCLYLTRTLTSMHTQLHKFFFDFEERKKKTNLGYAHLDPHGVVERSTMMTTWIAMVLLLQIQCTILGKVNDAQIINSRNLKRILQFPFVRRLNAHLPFQLCISWYSARPPFISKQGLESAKRPICRFDCTVPGDSVSGNTPVLTDWCCRQKAAPWTILGEVWRCIEIDNAWQSACRMRAHLRVLAHVLQESTAHAWTQRVLTFGDWQVDSAWPSTLVTFTLWGAAGRSGTTGRIFCAALLYFISI
jgi:hypothetical protein